MQQHNVEQGTDEWHKVRAGIPTGSCFGKMITSTGAISDTLKKYALTLAGDRIAGKSLDEWEGNQWTERGSMLEERARTMYEMLRDCEVVETGFITDDAGEWGVSPDGLVGDDGLVEFKCLKPENHIEAILYHAKSGKVPPKYVQQIQGQMLICERKWCDLMFYHPDLQPHIIRVYPDPKITAALVEAKKLVLDKRDEIIATLKQVEKENA